MAEYGLGRAFRDRRLNAGLAWAFVALLLVVSVEEVIVGEYLSAAFLVVVASLAIYPAVQARTPWVMLPWEIIGLASLPTIGRALASWAPAGDLATYLSVAAVALIVAVELHAFTPVQMNYSFAVLFVVVTTLAAAGIWAVARWLSDVWLGTAFITSETDLMWEFVWSTVAGLLAGGIFRLYFRRTAFTGRIPHEIAAIEEENREDGTDGFGDRVRGSE